MRYIIEAKKNHFNLILIIDLLIVFAIYLIFGFNTVSHAQEENSSLCNNYPCQQIFIITAYYSPLVDQSKYLTGSYESEIRLNGRGTNGADGTEVYSGMIAAPKNIPFGMRMNISGFGIGTVHDRGGAIVASGIRGNKYPRLDLWMGKGDEGLKRALAWGKRTVEVTVLGMDKDIQENVYFENSIEIEEFIQDKVKIFSAKIFKQDLGYGDKNENVKKLQEYLTAMGYYHGVISGFYDENTRQAIILFQMDYGIVDTEEEFGAGYFGPNSRKTFDRAFEEFKNGQFFGQDLGRNAKGENVSKLQKALKRLNYLNTEITGIYDEATVEAVFHFQTDNKIILNEYDSGAGYFGPVTKKILQQELLKLAEQEAKFANSKEELLASNKILENYADLQENFVIFTRSLELGDFGDEVRFLQDELKKLGYFKTGSTGYFGSVTAHAVFKFQQKLKLVDKKTDVGAGVLGPQTRAYLNRISENRLNMKKTIALSRDTKNQFKPAAEEKIEDSGQFFFEIDMAFGDRREEVKKLQEYLKKEGFFKGLFITDYFGEKTKEAVIAFQLSKGIIKSTNDTGAGRVGPTTRESIGLKI